MSETIEMFKKELEDLKVYNCISYISEAFSLQAANEIGFDSSAPG